MRNKCTKLVWVVAVAALILVACGRRSAEQNTIRIAVVAPITGAQADVGQDLLNGERFAVDERNSRGGVLNKKIELVVFDDGADPKEAVSVAHKIASDPTIVGVVGHMNSGTTKPATPIYNEAGIAIVMPVPTNPEITQRGLNNLFRVPPTDLDQGTDIAKFALERLHKKRFAIIHDSTAYGKPLAEVVRKTVQAAGAQVVAFEGISEGDTDFRSLLTRIRSVNPDALFFGGIYNEAGLIAKQANELGLKVSFLAADGSFAQKFVDIAGKASEGAVMSFIAPDDKGSEVMRSFATRFGQKYGTIKAFAPLGYDAANILIAGIEKAGKSDRKLVIAALHSGDFEYAGVTGNSHFEANGDNARRMVYFFVVKNGKFEPIAR